MAITPATKFSTEMAALVGNAGGALQSLPSVTMLGGRERMQLANIAMNSQLMTDIIHIARLPVGSIVTGINVITDTSLVTATLSFGDASNLTRFSTAATYTATQLKTAVVGSSAIFGTPLISPLYDQSGALSTDHEDVLMYIAIANLPATGTLRVMTNYVMD